MATNTTALKPTTTEVSDELKISSHEKHYVSEKDKLHNANVIQNTALEIPIPDAETEIRLNPNRKRETNKSYKDFISIFIPIHYICSMFFVPKFGIKHNKFVVNSKLCLFLTIIINLAFIFLCVYTLYEFIILFETTSVVTIYMTIYVQYIFQYINLSVLSVRLKNDNLKLINTLKEIYRYLYIRNDVMKNRLCLLIPCVVLTVAYIVLVTLKLSLDPVWSWNRGVFIFSTLIFDSEMIYAGYVLYFLAYNTKLWANKIMKDNEICEEFTKDMALILEKLFEAVSLAQKIFQMTILYHFCSTFIQALCFIEILLIWIKNETVDIKVLASHALGVVVWVTKGLTVDTAVCFCAEYLYSTMEMAKHATIYRLNIDTSEIRKFSKNLLRVSDKGVSKINAWGVFTVDATLPLRMVGSVATYTIVLLQFAFLDT